MATNALKLSMVGKKFEICSSQIAKNALKLSTIFGGNFEIYLSQIAKNVLKLITMVGKKYKKYIMKKYRKNRPFRKKQAKKQENRQNLKKQEITGKQAE